MEDQVKTLQSIVVAAVGQYLDRGSKIAAGKYSIVNESSEIFVGKDRWRANLQKKKLLVGIAVDKAH